MGVFLAFFFPSVKGPSIKNLWKYIFKYTITHFPFSGRLIKCFCFLFKTVSVLGALTYRITNTEQVAFPLSVMTGGVQCFICLLFFFKEKNLPVEYLIISGLYTHQKNI